jgi:hypothetical protein
MYKLRKDAKFEDSTAFLNANSKDRSAFFSNELLVLHISSERSHITFCFHSTFFNFHRFKLLSLLFQPLLLLSPQLQIKQKRLNSCHLHHFWISMKLLCSGLNFLTHKQSM